MPVPHASQALSRFTVLDLTRVRSGPTCVRQLADWGANVIKIDALLEDAAAEQPGGPRRGSDFQNLHRNKRAMTLNLQATDQDGFANNALEEYELIVRPDQMPTVQIENPRRNEERTPVAVIPLQGAAEDDYGIKTMTLMVDRLGDNAKHWAVPLVVNSAPVDGVTWSQLDSSGDRRRFRMNFSWDLARLDAAGVKPGDILEYYLQVRDNFELDGQYHDPVNSGKLRIAIISQEQYTQVITDTLRNLAGQVAEIRNTQNRTKQDTGNLKKDTEIKPQFDEADRSIAERLANQQSTAASQTKEVASKLNDLMQNMDENKSPATDLKDTAKDVRNQLNSAAEQPMKDAAGEIDQAKDAKADPHAAADQQARDIAARNQTLAQAQSNQQQASDQLQKALDRMGNVGDLQQMIDKVAEALRRQEEISAQTARIGKDNLGKTPDQMSQADRDALQKAADDQKALAAQTEKDIQDLQKASEATAKSDPSASDAMKQAAQTGQQQSVTANMSKASDAARQNQQASAQSGQKQAELGLQTMLNELREAEQRRLEELSKRLEDLQKQIAELIQQQAGHNLDDLHLQGDAVFAKLDAQLVDELLSKADRAKDQQPPAPELPQLTSLQEQTERNTRDISKSAEDLPDGAEPAGHLSRAAEKMERAIVALRATKLADAYDPPMVEALASLEEAKKLIDEQKAKVDQALDDRQRETIRQAYVKIRDDQVKLDKDTSGLDQAPRGADGQLGHGDAVRLGRLPGNQGDLSDRAAKLTDDLAALGSVVYVWANKDIVKSMREVKDELAKPDTGKLTQAEQTRVVDQLTAMIDSLATKPPSKRFEDPKSGGGGGGGGGGAKLPAEAELRLLKQLQTAINTNTKAVDSGADKDKPKLLALGERQGELRNLLDELLKKASDGQMSLGPEPTDEVKLPEEADDQSIDEQELEQKLMDQKPQHDPAQNDVNLIGARMSRSKTRLADDSDPGTVTQKIQDRILANMDDLIKMAQQQQQSSSQASGKAKSQQQQKPGEGQKQPDNSQANGKQPGQPNPNHGNNPAQISALPGNPDGTADISQNIDERLAEWGKTSPRQRAAVIEGASEKVLQKYKSFVDDYFKSVATESTDRGK